MSMFTIVRDSREKKPYDFSGMPSVDVEQGTLETGDYTVKECAFHDPKRDTWVPRFAVERKGESDLTSSITYERERFRDEIRRADGWQTPLAVIIESSRKRFENENYYADMTSSQVFGTLDKWANNYNCDFYFRKDRTTAAELAFDFLTEWYRMATEGEI